MPKRIVSLVGKKLGVMEYLKKVALLIISLYATSIISSRETPIFIYPRRLFTTVLKWWRIVTFYLLPDAKISTARYWLDSAREKHSLYLPFLENELNTA